MARATATHAKEIVLCGQDPVHFINKYAMIQTPMKGTIKFDTYEFQDDCVQSFIDHRFNIIVKARQLGLSTVTAIYAVWLAIFYRDKNILVIATKLATAQNFIKKVKVALNALPKWLVLPSVTERTKQLVAFSNGSQIKAIPTSEDAGRSEALSLLIVDEAAFIRDFDTLWTGLYFTLAEGGRAIIISTPNGTGGMYHKLVEDAEAGTSEFNLTKLMWHAHPKRDDVWLEKEVKNMTPHAIAQELMCDFAGSGNTFVTADIIERLRLQIEPPIERWGAKNEIWQWAYPQVGEEFVVSADVSRGDANDYSSFQVINKNTAEQVCEYRGKIRPDQFGVLLDEVGKKFNNALICPENNTYGQGTILKLVELGYKNLHFKSLKDKFDLMYGDPTEVSLGKVGFVTSVKTRGPILRLLEERLRNNTIKVRSSRLVDELKTFVMKGDKPVAKKGSFDDVVMAMAIGNSLVEPGTGSAVKSQDSAKGMLAGFGVNKRHKDTQREVTNVNNVNPYMNMPNGSYGSRGRPEHVPSEFSWVLG